MNALTPVVSKLSTWAERLNALSLRERGMIFAACVTLVFLAWQTLVMGPVTDRARSAEQRLAETRQHLAAIEQLGAAASMNPATAAAVRNRALKERLTSLDLQLNSAAQSYVAPERVTEMLRQILASQRGLSLVSLANLPVESLSQAPGGAPLAAADRGPFLHPVEIVVDGDYASVVAYLRAIEGLPWRIHWQQLDLTAGDYPLNRVRIVIGALSLSRDWITV